MVAPRFLSGKPEAFIGKDFATTPTVTISSLGDVELYLPQIMTIILL